MTGSVQAENSLSRSDGLAKEDRPNVARIARLYEVVLGREPDVHGLRHFTGSLRDGTSLATIVQSFFQGDEFKSRHPHLDPTSTDSVQALYSMAAGLPRQTREMADPASMLAAMIDADVAEGRDTMVPALRALEPQLTNPIVYTWWSEEYGRISAEDQASITSLTTELPRRPTFSLLTFVEAISLDQLSEAVQSVLEQVYDAVELILITQGRLEPTLAKLVREFRSGDDRVRVSASSRWRGVASSWNKALRASKGDFIGTVGSRDCVEATALLEFAATARRWPETQVMFCDEDTIGQEGSRCAPRFKSNFDLDRMLVENYTGRLTLLRRDLALRLEGWRPASRGVEEYDFALRATASLPASAIRHIPHVLYHGRTPPPPLTEPVSSTLAAAGAFLAATQPGSVIELMSPLKTGLGHPVPRVNRTGTFPTPPVSIIVPTRDRCDILRSCVGSLLSRTLYPAFDVVIVDNGSTEPESAAFLADLAANDLAHVVRYNGPFNWGAMNNAGVSACSGEVVVLLNNDTEVINSDWLLELVSQVMRPEVGAVGAKLLYPADGSVQHAGIVVGPDGAGRHIFRHCAGDEDGYLSLLTRVRTVSAVTGACIALRRTTLEDVGGIEEAELQVTCSDVDLCLRVQELGYRVIWTPFARLWHKELATRGPDDTSEKVARAAKEQSYLSRKWEAKLRSDPYWSPNLALEEQVKYLAVPPRANRAWKN